MHAQITTSSDDDAPIAVFGFPGLGDLVRCHSLIQMIAAQYPRRPIDLIARRPIVDVVKFMPEVRDAIGTGFRHNRLSMVERLRLVQTLRARNYAAAYIIQSSFKAAVVPFLAQIPERIGWACEGRRPLLTKAHFGMQRVPRMVDRICRLGLPAGATPPPRWPEPRLRVPHSLREEFDALANRKDSRPVIAMAPASSDDRKNWPTQNYAAIARRYIDAGCTVWIVGETRHRRFAAAISERARVRDHLTDSLTTLALTIAAADVFVGNDSGPLHVAAAFGKPSVGVFGLTDASINAPINDAVKIAIPELAIARHSRKEIHWPSLEPVTRRLDRAIDSVRKRETVDA